MEDSLTPFSQLPGGGVGLESQLPQGELPQHPSDTLPPFDDEMPDKRMRVSWPRDLELCNTHRGDGHWPRGLEMCEASGTKFAAFDHSQVLGLEDPSKDSSQPGKPQQQEQYNKKSGVITVADDDPASTQQPMQVRAVARPMMASSSSPQPGPAAVAPQAPGAAAALAASRQPRMAAPLEAPAAAAAPAAPASGSGVSSEGAKQQQQQQALGTPAARCSPVDKSIIRIQSASDQGIQGAGGQPTKRRADEATAASAGAVRSASESESADNLIPMPAGSSEPFNNCVGKPSESRGAVQCSHIYVRSEDMPEHCKKIFKTMLANRRQPAGHRMVYSATYRAETRPDQL